MAIEKIWDSVLYLSSLKIAISMMETLNPETIQKLITKQNEKINQWFSIIYEMCSIDMDKLKEKSQQAINVQSFISPLSWSFYQAYQSIIVDSVTTVYLLKNSSELTKDIFDFDRSKHIFELLKIALPEQADYINKKDKLNFIFLLDELEKKLLTSFYTTLKGESLDKETLDNIYSINQAFSKSQGESLNQEILHKIDFMNQASSKS